MINAIKRQISNWKFAALAISVGVYFVSVSCSEGNQKEELVQPDPFTGQVYTVVENMPQHAQGLSGIAEELNSVLKYPAAAKEKGVQGTVFVEFIVQPNGNLSDYKIVKGVDPDLDHAALLAVSKFKPWIPGTQDGKPVATKMVLPIKFELA